MLLKITFTLLALVPILVIGQTATISASKDNTIYETPNVSNGSGEFLFTGQTLQSLGASLRRTLLQFNVAASIPAGATITGATLTLHLSRTISGPTNCALYPVLQNWGEGNSNASGQEGTGATSQTNDASWSCSFSNGSGGCATAWSSAGGNYNSTASATTSVSGIGFYSWTSAQLIADVQNMLDNNGSNFGWILLGDEISAGTAKRFDSRSNPISANRPVLTVTYTTCNAPSIPAPVASMSTICSPQNVTITWPTAALNDATNWHIYTGGCGTTPLSTTTTNSLIVNPTATTTYFIRGEDGAGCVDETTGACGSVTVSVGQPNTGVDTRVVCDSLQWIDGNTYFANNNVATFTLTNASGCDSVVTLNLTVSNVTPTVLQLTPTQDNAIFSENSNSSGAGQLYSGRNNSGNLRRSLVQFDLSSIPAGAVITNAVLEVSVDQYSGSTSNNFNLHRLANSWGEGTSVAGGSGAPAIAPDATWTDATFGTFQWTVAGGDIINPTSATTLFSTALGIKTFESTRMVDDINFWLTIPVTNKGWMIIGDETANQTVRRLGSKEIGTAPVLKISYIIPQDPDTTVVVSCTSYQTPGGLTLTTSGIYPDTLSGTAGCDSISYIDFTLNSVISTVTQSGALLTADEVGATYAWLNCPSYSPINGETNQSFTATANGSYAVSVTKNGCTDTSACVLVSGLGIVQNDFGIGFSVYPNPTKGSLTIDLGEINNMVNCKIENSIGQTVQNKTLSNTQIIEIELSEVPGIYFLTILSGTNKAILRIVKE